MGPLGAEGGPSGWVSYEVPSSAESGVCRRIRSLAAIAQGSSRGTIAFPPPRTSRPLRDFRIRTQPSQGCDTGSNPFGRIPRGPPHGATVDHGRLRRQNAFATAPTGAPTGKSVAGCGCVLFRGGWRGHGRRDGSPGRRGRGTPRGRGRASVLAPAATGATVATGAGRRHRACLWGPGRGPRGRSWGPRRPSPPQRLWSSPVKSTAARRLHETCTHLLLDSPPEQSPASPLRRTSALDRGVPPPAPPGRPLPAPAPRGRLSHPDR